MWFIKNPLEIVKGSLHLLSVSFTTIQQLIRNLVVHGE